MDHGDERRENLIALSQHAEKFESSGYRGLFAFVTHLRRLLELEKAPVTGCSATTNGVQLMSIHKSKGLEFPIVILADLEHGFSRKDFDTAVLVHHKLGLGPQCIDLKRRIRYPTLARLAIERMLRRENLAEEQRILYVAMTRPKEKLIMVSSVYSAAGYLKKLAAVATCPVLPETVAEGKCFGDWLLLPLLCRPEAALLRELADLSIEQLYISDSRPWQVNIHDSEEFREVPQMRRSAVDDTTEETLFSPDILGFEYPFSSAAFLPAKVTATQLKGRLLDEEITEHTQKETVQYTLKNPRFWQERNGLTPAERGIATHLVMQYLDFGNQDAAAQVERLVCEEKLTREQADAVNCEMLERFLKDPLAEELRNARRVWREFPFTRLVDAREADPEAPAGEQVLLQGVIDCFFETEEGLTVIDFKTDRILSETDLLEKAETYRIQLETYSKSLEKIFEKPVNRQILYFLGVSAAVEL
jgi:ATP-dependent helicase/nuclease subunit A